MKQAVEMHAEENKRKMEAVLNQLRAGAASLPEDERKKLDQQVKVLESDKENISKVLSQLGAGLDSVPSDDRAELQSQLKREAWDPTRDAIGVSLFANQTAGRWACCTVSVRQSRHAILSTSPSALFCFTNGKVFN